MSTSVIMLNGSPSAGKTTLATAFQAACPEPVFHLSLDEFRSGIRAEVWTPERSPALFAEMMRAYLHALAAVAGEGIPVVTETVILPRIRHLYDPFFERFDVTLVGVRCPLDVARAREARRQDRRNGPVELDVPEFSLVHQHDYALEVDTSAEDTETSVARIMRKCIVRGHPR